MLVFLLFALDLGKSTKAGLYTPLLFPPGGPRIPPGPPQEVHDGLPFFDQNLHRFLAPIFGRFGAVLGPSWGVIFGLLGLQVRSRWRQEASSKLIFVKNTDFAPILRFPIRKLLFGPQDGAQNGPRSAQDGSKTLLKRVFFALENRLGF